MASEITPAIAWIGRVLKVEPERLFMIRSVNREGNSVYSHPQIGEIIFGDKVLKARGDEFLGFGLNGDIFRAYYEGWLSGKRKHYFFWRNSDEVRLYNEGVEDRRRYSPR